MKKLLIAGFAGVLLAGVPCHGNIFKKMAWALVPSLKDRALLNAAATGNVKNVKMALDAGANANALDKKHGFSALMYAAANGHNKVVTMLIESGANVNACVWISIKTPWTGARYERIGGDHAYTALSEARKNKHYKVVKTLIEAGAVDIRTGYDGNGSR